ncbi:MAG: hypothetical protein ABIT64_05750 [Lysobacteraceae bacterium]
MARCFPFPVSGNQAIYTFDAEITLVTVFQFSSSTRCAAILAIAVRQVTLWTLRVVQFERATPLLANVATGYSERMPHKKFVAT